MSSDGRVHWLLHSFVECRTRTGAWWLYARPTVPADDTLADMLTGRGVERGERAIHDLGVPSDVSLVVRDEYTWRVAGPRGGDAANIVSVDEAERWVARGVSRRWRTDEPFVRVIDPRWCHGSWMDVIDLARLVDRYQHDTGQIAPATVCALIAMMHELERDYVVRLVFWLERVYAAEPAPPPDPHERVLRDHTADLEKARATARRRRPRRIGSG